MSAAIRKRQVYKQNAGGHRRRRRLCGWGKRPSSAAPSVGRQAMSISSAPGDHADINSFEFGGYGSYGLRSLLCRRAGELRLPRRHDDARNSIWALKTVVGNASYKRSRLDRRRRSRHGLQVGRRPSATDVGRELQPAPRPTASSKSGAGGFSLVVADGHCRQLHYDARHACLGRVDGRRHEARAPTPASPWRHEFADTRQSFTTAFLDDPTTQFSIISSRISPDSAVVAAGMTAGVTKGPRALRRLQRRPSIPTPNTHNGSAGFRATWLGSVRM